MEFKDGRVTILVLLILVVLELKVEVYGDERGKGMGKGGCGSQRIQLRFDGVWDMRYNLLIGKLLDSIMQMQLLKSGEWGEIKIGEGAATSRRKNVPG